MANQENNKGSKQPKPVGKPLNEGFSNPSKTPQHRNAIKVTVPPPPTKKKPD